MSGATLGEDIAGAEVYNADVILPRERALVKSGSLAVLRGNLAPDGAVIKPAAAEPHLLRHAGPRSCSRTTTTWRRASTIRTLPATKDSVIVLKSAGPLGAPGMPEWGQLPIPKKLLEQGVRDMLRISDARMSGTSYGACVLHVAPESYVGGPLALVRDGDMIALDVDARIAARSRSTTPSSRAARPRGCVRAPHFERGFGALYQAHITQANEGCDFDFLEGTAPTAEPEIH